MIAIKFKNYSFSFSHSLLLISQINRPFDAARPKLQLATASHRKRGLHSVQSFCASSSDSVSSRTQGCNERILGSFPHIRTPINIQYAINVLSSYHSTSPERSNGMLS
jgi:hypothetical protein